MSHVGTNFCHLDLLLAYCALCWDGKIGRATVQPIPTLPAKVDWLAGDGGDPGDDEGTTW